MALSSPRFNTNRRLVAASNNSPPLGKGASGRAVAIIQQALIDLGFELPVSTQRHGHPDGIYGQETVLKVKDFQRRQHLKDDGVVGRDTMTRLDRLLPGPAPAPSGRMTPRFYTVPGFKSVIAQPTNQVCWATVYAMMRSWKYQQSFDIEQAATAVGAKYGEMVRNNQALPSDEFGAFIRAAGMRLQPMMNLPLEEWIWLLQDFGLLWVGQLNAVSPAAGLHSRILEGVRANEEFDNGDMILIDPAGGRRYTERFDVYQYKYEMAIVGIGGMYFQIRHF